MLIGTAVSASNQVLRDVRDTLRDLPDPIPTAFAREFQAGTIYHPVPPEFFERVIVESLKLPPRLWRLALDRLLEYDDSAAIARIETRTLLLWGDHDALFPRTDQEALLAALPMARLKVYAETGHCPNWERPEQVAADIGAFLRQSAS